MGRNALNPYESTFKRMEEEGDILFDPGLWWVYWPVSNKGAWDESALRALANYLEEKNRPIVEGYDRYCEENN